jgi:hypothetical protein
MWCLEVIKKINKPKICDACQKREIKEEQVISGKFFCKKCKKQK